jgi:hypothetical protein
MHCTWSVPLILLQVTNLNYGIIYIIFLLLFSYVPTITSVLCSQTPPTHFFLSVVQQPKSGLGRLFVWFLDHTQTHTHPVGLLRTCDKLVAETATYTTRNTHNRTPMAQRSSKPRFQRSGCRRPKPKTARLAGSANNTH